MTLGHAGTGLRFRLSVGLLLILAGAAAPSSLQAQPAIGRTVLDGVYTAEQASRGRELYGTRCASCHRADLSGFSAPPLKGDLFMDRWREFNLDVLFTLIESQMPLDSPRGLSKGMYLDVTSFLLQANGAPAGTRELTQDVVSETRLVGANGPMPLPTSAQVVVAGCMTRDSGFGWFLTAATQPARTLDAFVLAEPELRTADQAPLGGLVFRLQNLQDLPVSPAGLVGRKVIAKGILVRQEKGNRINVTALQAVGAACEANSANAPNN